METHSQFNLIFNKPVQFMFQQINKNLNSQLITNFPVILALLMHKLYFKNKINE
jgi:hypothetical protein